MGCVGNVRGLHFGAHTGCQWRTCAVWGQGQKNKKSTSHFLHWKRHPRGRFIIFSCTLGHCRGHLIMFSPLERHPRGHSITISTLEGHPRGHFDMLSCTLSPCRGHFIMCYLPQGHRRGHFCLCFFQQWSWAINCPHWFPRQSTTTAVCYACIHMMLWRATDSSTMKNGYLIKHRNSHCGQSWAAELTAELQPCIGQRETCWDDDGDEIMMCVSCKLLKNIY